jgi:glutamate formiminotransferase
MSAGFLLGLDPWSALVIVGAMVLCLAVAVFLYLDTRTAQTRHVLAQVERIQHEGQPKP